MNQERQNIDNLLRDKFLSFEGDVQASDWSAIANKLDKKRRLPWLWWISIPLLIFGTLSYYLLNNTVLNLKNTNEIIKTNKVEYPSTKQLPMVVENDGKLIAPQINKKTNPSTFITPSQTKNNHNIVIETISTPLISYLNLNLKSKTIDQLWLHTHQPIHNILWAQSNEALEKLKQNKTFKSKKPLLTFEFGINLSPATAIDAIKENKSSFINHSYFSAISNSSSFGTGFNNGIHAQMNIGKHWFLRQGIYGTNYSVNQNYDYTITESVHVTDGIGIRYYLPLNSGAYRHINYTGNTKVQFISLPFQIGNRYYINEKFGIESKVGITLSKLWSSMGQTVNPTTLDLENLNGNNSIKNWNSGLTISTGLLYKPNNKFIFTVEPNLSTILGSAFNKNYPVKIRYSNYGVNLNINYILGQK